MLSVICAPCSQWMILTSYSPDSSNSARSSSAKWFNTRTRIGFAIFVDRKGFLSGWQKNLVIKSKINNMRKLIAAINMTLDGFCDHTAANPDDELMEHYNDLMTSADTLLYGRITYELMKSYWPSLVKNPSGNKPDDEFAILMDNISKIVYS